MTATIVTDNRAERLTRIAAELAELAAQGVAVVVDADRLLELEERGIVVDVTTGKPVEPVLPVGGRYARR